jgi:penicillin-binding protein 1A
MKYRSSKSVSALLAALLTSSLLVGSTGLSYIRSISDDLPDVSSIVDYRPRLHSTFRDLNGQVVYKLGAERRVLIGSTALPSYVKLAFISAEDGGFYDHNGISVPAIIRAATSNIANGGVTSGASTITQQLVKNVLLSPDQNLKRKAQEAILAMRLEKLLGKDEILSRYLSEIYLGRGAYGVVSAAETYFGIDASQISLAQTAILAGLPKSPSKLSSNHSAAKARAQYVLNRMLEDGHINDASYRLALMDLRAIDLSPRPEMTQEAPSHFVASAIDEVKKRDRSIDLAEAGQDITLSMVPSYQDALEKSLRTALVAYDRGHSDWMGPVVSTVAPLVPEWEYAEVMNSEGAIRLPGNPTIFYLSKSSLQWVSQSRKFLPAGSFVIVERVGNGFELRQEPKVQGGMVAIDPKTRKVLAMTGAFNERISDFNRVTLASRQPGSVLKPFVYAQALQAGWSPNSPILDSDVELDASGTGKYWSPDDHGKSNQGYVTLRKALEDSRNTAMVRMYMALGQDSVAQLMVSLGVYDDTSMVGPSLALGAYETTLMKLVMAYAALADDGSVRPLSFIANDNSLKPVTPPLFDEITLSQIRSIMLGVVKRGTAKTAFVDAPYDVYGKTGTTNESKDSWFVGFTDDVLVGAFVGFDEPTPMGKGSSGGSLAAPMVRSFMDSIGVEFDASTAPLPFGAELQTFNPDSGLPSSKGFPEIIRN